MDISKKLEIWKYRYFKWCRFSKTYTSSEELATKYGPWLPPNEELSKNRPQAHHGNYSVCGTTTEELKDFGLGHLLYFYFLKYMAFLFGALAIAPALINISFNLAGQWYTSGDFQYTTLGDFGPISYNGNEGSINWTVSYKGYQAEQTIARYFLADAGRPSATLNGGADKQGMQVTMAMLDLSSCLIYFCVTLFLIWLSHRNGRKASESVVSIHDFSVFVADVPCDAEVPALVEYFQQYGDVEKVELARACGTLVGHVGERASVADQLETALAQLRFLAQTTPQVDTWYEKEVEVLTQYKAQLEADIAKRQRSASGSAVVAAFVTFRTDTGRLACLAAQPASAIQRMMLKPEQRFMQQFVLRVKEAPEPTDLKYENLEIFRFNHFMRRLTTGFIKFVLLLLGFLLVNFAPAMRNGLTNNSDSSGPSQATCFSTCHYVNSQGVLYLSPTMRTEYENCYNTNQWVNGTSCGADTICFKCYCETSLGAGNLGDASYCSPFSTLVLEESASQVVAVLGIVVVNQFLTWAAYLLTGSERHQTLSEESCSLAITLFLYQFINTAFSTIIANAYLPWFEGLFNNSFLNGILFTGIYPDLTPDWYRDVGRPILLSQFTGIIIRMAVIGSRFLLHWWGTRKKYLSQCELDKAYEGPIFELATRYGEHLTVVFTTFLFAGAMPLMLPIAAASFAVHYWAEKAELLRLSRRPPATDAALGLKVMNFLPAAVLLHVIFSMWAFSLFGVPASPFATSTWTQFMNVLCSDLGGLWSLFSDYTPAEVSTRLLQENAAPFMVFLFVLAAAFLVLCTLQLLIAAYKWLKETIGCSGKKIAPEEPVPESEKSLIFGKMVETQRLVGLDTYLIERNPHYLFAFITYDEGVPLKPSNCGLDFQAVTNPKSSAHLSSRSASISGSVHAQEDEVKGVETVAVVSITPAPVITGGFVREPSDLLTDSPRSQDQDLGGQDGGTRVPVTESVDSKRRSGSTNTVVFMPPLAQPQMIKNGSQKLNTKANDLHMAPPGFVA